MSAQRLRRWFNTVQIIWKCYCAYSAVFDASPPLSKHWLTTSFFMGENNKTGFYTVLGGDGAYGVLSDCVLNHISHLSEYRGMTMSIPGVRKKGGIRFTTGGKAGHHSNSMAPLSPVSRDRGHCAMKSRGGWATRELSEIGNTCETNWVRCKEATARCENKKIYKIPVEVREKNKKWSVCLSDIIFDIWITI